MSTSELKDSDVAITGMAFRLPGIKTYEKLADALFRDMPLRPKCTEAVPKGYHGEFPAPGYHAENMNTLDAIFFGMSNILLTTADRTQMKVLEMTFEALTDAGINPTTMRDLVSNVYQNTVRADGEFNDVMHVLSRYHVLGNSRALAPNRISFHFDMKGSSVSLDAGYTGGMKALELGWRDIKNGLADLVVVTSANLFIDENMTREMSDLGWLSKDGNTRVFDNEADGYRRTEAVVSMILQPATQAKRIYALVRHVTCFAAMNEFSFQSPTKDSWAEFLKHSYEQCRISPEQIEYLEAYGSAHKEWDAHELNAVMDVLGANRQGPLLVGSVKSNLGHTEGASDLVNIIKAIICFEHGKIPANKNFKSPNSAIPSLIKGQLKVVEETTNLKPDALIAINGYSYGNTYGHCILEGFKKPKTIVTDNIPRLIPLSARIEDMFPLIFQEVEAVSFDLDYFNLLYSVFTERITKHLARGYMIFSKGEKTISSYQPIDETERPLWLVFSGMGSQWTGMGRDLMELPIARASIQKCHDILVPQGLDLINIVTSDHQEIFKDNLNSFVGIAAMQIALVDLLNALKIVPDGIIGHSVGEVGCAYADGSLDLEQTILAAYYRGKAVKDATLIRGAMAAIGKGYESLKDEMPETVEIACHNSNTSSTISGPENEVLDIVAKLSKDGVFAKIVEVGNIAFHSRYIAPAGSYLLSYMQKTIRNPKMRSSKWVSSSVPEASWNSESAQYASPEYFTNNLLSAVLFEETCKHVPENAILLEVAPHGLLQAIMKRSFPKAINIALASRSAGNNLTFFLQAIGKLYMTGVCPDIAALYPKVEFPVGTKTNSLHSLFPWTTIPKSLDITCTWTSTLNVRQLIKKSNNSHEAHVFHGRRCTPFSYYPLLIWNTSYQSEPSILGSAFFIQDLRVFDPFEFHIESDLELEGFALTNSHLIELTKNGMSIASAVADKFDGKHLKSVPATERDEILLSFSKDEIYELLDKKGYLFSKSTRFLNYAAWTTKGMRGKIAYTADWEKNLEAMLQLVYLNIASKENSLVTVKKIGMIEVAAPERDSNQLEDIELFYDPATNELSCSGIYIQSITFKTHADERELYFSSILPYFNPPLQTLPEYIDFCSQIVAETKGIDPSVGEWTVLELQNEKFQPLSPLIQSISPNIQAKLIPLGGELEDIGRMGIVICNSNQLQNLGENIGKFVLVRVHVSSKKETEVPADLSIVSTYIYNNEEKMILLKKKVALNEEIELIRIPEREGDLISTLRRSAETKTSALLVGFIEPADGIANFMKRIQSQTTLVLKWMFILDETAPDFNVANPFYKQQLEKGLFLNVLLNKSWNFVYEQQIEALSSGNELTKPVEGETMRCDSELSWELPSEWKSENTSDDVAAAYAMAYFCLVTKAITKNYEGVLITDGCSLMGQAAIHVAFTRTNQVYTTVGSVEEATKLKTLIPRLDDEKIFLHTDPHILVHIFEKTGKECPNIIYNLLDGHSGYNLLEYSPRYSKIFHFGSEEIESNRQIGMGPFMNMVSFIAMSVKNIKKWHNTDKREVWHLVEEGIRNGTVRPLKNIETSNNLPSMRSQKIQHLVSKCYRENKFDINASSAYLILGESTQIDLDVAEWLARRGANKIVLYNPSQADRNEYTRKLKLLKLHHKEANFQISNESSLEGLLRDIKHNLVPLEAVFYIHLLKDAPSRQVSLVEEALTAEFKHFVTISRNQRYALKFHKVLQPRKTFTDILWNVEEYLILQNIDVLTNLIGEHSYLTVDDKLKQTPFKYHLDFVSELLPRSLDSYQALGAGLTNEPAMIEVATLGRKMDKICTLEIQPVFLFPGVEEESIEGVTALAKGLSVPAFVAKAPAFTKNTSIANLASVIIPAIVKVVKRKVYNLVGLSTGCILAMEVARQMEQKGAVVALMLVDNPAQYLQQLENKSVVNSAILHAIESLMPNQVREGLHESLPWNIRLNHLISSFNLPPTTESIVSMGAHYISTQLNAAASFDIDNLQLNGPLTVIRSEDFVDQLPYRQICTDHYIQDFAVAHNDLLKSNQLAKLINTFIVLDDMGPKTIHDVLWVPFEKALARHRVNVSKSLKIEW